MQEAFNYDYVKEKIANELNSDRYNTFEVIKEDLEFFKEYLNNYIALSINKATNNEKNNKSIT